MSVRRLRRLYTYTYIHAHTCTHMCMQRNMCTPAYTQGHTHMYISRVKPGTGTQGYTSLGHTKALQHTRVEWTSAYRCAQRDTVLCVPAHAHTQAHREGTAREKSWPRPTPFRTGRKANWLRTGWWCIRQWQAEGPGSPKQASAE